jgi:hypothetical protein
MSYYNLCGIGPQHSNISKGKKKGGGGGQQREVGRLLGEVNCD